MPTTIITTECIAQHDRRTFSPSAHEGADGAAVESLEQHQDSEDIDAAVQHQKKHTPSLASKLRSNFDLCSHAVATYSHSFWDKTQGYFARLTETAKPRARRHRRNNRSGLSIGMIQQQSLFSFPIYSNPIKREPTSDTASYLDLPIMKRPAWQKLASGASSTITPSATTLGELNNGNGAAAPSHTELERGGVELHASPAALSESGTQTEEGLLLARPEPAVTVGLAIG